MTGREYRCNCCGKTLAVKNGILQEDALIIKKEWGYFSHKDLEIHELVLCEECYDRWVAQLMVPIRIKQKNEVMDS